MNYEDLGFREEYNEIMYNERAVIEKFLIDQYDLRYGRQRDTWHFEPAVKMLSRYGNVEYVTDIMLDKDRFVIFILNDHREYECTDFAYGELSKVIEALPDADEIVKKNAVNDLSEFSVNLRCDLILQESPFMYKGIKVDNVLKDDEGVHICVGELAIADEHYDADFLSKLRDHINIEHLHRTNEYKNLMGLLDNFYNKAFNFVEHKEFPSVNITILGTDMELSVLDVCKNEDGRLVIYACTDSEEDIYLYDKDIRPEYLFDIIKVIKEHVVYDIMDTYNGHNVELVRKINAAWRDDKYHDGFGDILFAIAQRDSEEIAEKYGDLCIHDAESAMLCAHEIMEGVCDDLDLECILNFIRYEEN